MQTEGIPLTAAQEQQDEQQAAQEGVLHKDLVAVDICANVLTGGNEDETISSRMERWRDQGKGVEHLVGAIVSDGLDLIQPNHGIKAEAADVERAQHVIAVENAAGMLPK